MKFAFTVDLEQDFGSDDEVSFGAIDKFWPELNKIIKDIPVTFFVTDQVLTNRPHLVKLLSENYEIGCHGTHKRLNKLSYSEVYSEISYSKKLFKNFGIKGFRSPFLMPPVFLRKVLEDLGFSYDSSISPVWFPGRFNNLKSPKTIYNPSYNDISLPSKKPGFYEKPISRVLGVPFALSYIKRIPKFLDMLEPENKDYVFYMHLHDLFCEKDRGVIRGNRLTTEQTIKLLQKLLQKFKNFEFVKMEDL